MSSSVFRAGGYPVHRIIKGYRDVNEEAKPKGDTVPVAERYQDLAAHIHKTAVTPRGDLYIWACLCGAAGIVREQGLRSADLVCAKHVIDEAAKLHDRLEGEPPDRHDDTTAK